MQIMLELKWKTVDIMKVLLSYSKKGKIDDTDFREMFLLFASKRKLKLMSSMINNEELNFTFEESNFVDVLENDVFDMGVLLYREYFLQITTEQEMIC